MSKSKEAVARFRQRERARKAGAATPAGCEKMPQGRPITLNPGLRTVQKLLQDLRKRVPHIATDYPRDVLDTKRYPSIVMVACQTCPDSEAARRGIKIPHAEEPVLLRKKNYEYPCTLIRASTVEKGGAGVFAGEDIKRNDYVGEYGGAAVDRKEGMKMRFEDGTDTHMRTLGRQCDYALDGRITKLMPIEEYLVGHKIGSFMNGSDKRKGLKANCKYDLIWDPGHSVRYPRADGGEGVWASEFWQASPANISADQYV